MIKFDVQDLIDKGLVVKKTYTDGVYKGLSVLKYHRKVFYDNLWHLDERLLHCRGIVVDEDWNVVVKPFKKVFNLGENNTTLDPSVKYHVVQKINGFMFAVTNTEKYGVICSTTGSLDSDYVCMGKEILGVQWLAEFEKEADFDVTVLFEICHKDDQHIVEEVQGAYIIGMIDFYCMGLDGIIEVPLNKFVERLDYMFYDYDHIKLPFRFKDYYYEVEALIDTGLIQIEGYMFIDPNTNETVCKLKTPHYLSKKAIMRLSDGKVDSMYQQPELFKQRIDEEFYSLVDYIVKEFDVNTWKGLTDQERREIIEEYFHE